MLLLSGALVSGPYALITTAVSADLVSEGSSAQSRGQVLPGAAAPSIMTQWSLLVKRSVSISTLLQMTSKDAKSLLKQIRGHGSPVP